MSQLQRAVSLRELALQSRPEFQSDRLFVLDNFDNIPIMASYLP
jgi:hypothetical protein